MASIKPLNVLIAGSGIAGGAFARYLLRAYKNANITIVERAPSLRLTGASVDVREQGVDIIKWMGIEQEIRDNSTQETGTRFVRGDGSTLAYLAATGDAENQGMTSEFEIFRGALAHILIRPALDKVKLIYDETIETYEQVDDKVNVTFTKSQETKSYDLLVAADGVGSKIRGQMLNTKPREQIRDSGVRVAFFTAKRDMLNGSRDGAWRALPGGRSLYIRPDPNPEGRTRCHLLVRIPETNMPKREKYDKAIAAGNENMMALLEEEFKAGDWLCQETLKEMRQCQDFYGSLFAQVRSPLLQQGRVVLLGDAGYATPGIGTSFAITGAYLLAGELLKSGCDVPAATKAYEDIMLPYVQKEQLDFDPFAVLSPQSEWAMQLRDTLLWSLDKLKLFSIMMYFGAMFGTKDKKKPPQYAWPEESTA